MDKMIDFTLSFEDLEEDANLYDDIDFSVVTEVKARYRRIPGQEDNPDLCALPKAYSPDVLMQRMTKRLPYNRDDVDRMSATERRASVIKIQDAFYPLNHMFEVAEAVDTVLTTSYMARENRISKFGGNMEAVKSVRNGCSGRSLFFLMSGPTGTGKSVAKDQVCRLYPKVIRHRIGRHEYVQIPILSSTCLVGNMSELILSFAVQLDELLDTGTLHADQLRSANLGLNCSKLKDMIKRYHVGLLIIDEVQFLNFSAGNASFENVVGIAEETGCAVGLIGNEEVNEKIQKFPRLVSRTMQQRIHVGFSSKTDRSFFEYALSDLWRYQWTKEVTPLTPEIKTCLLSDCMYNISVLKALLIMVQCRALKRFPKGGITAEYIHNISERELSEIRSLLQEGTAEAERKLIKMLTGKTKEAAQLTDKQTERLQALEAARVSGFSDANIWKMDTVEAIGKNQFGYNPAQVRRVLMKFMNKDPRFEELDVAVMVSMVNQYLEKYPDSKVKRAAGE